MKEVRFIQIYTPYTKRTHVIRNRSCKDKAPEEEEEGSTV